MECSKKYSALFQKKGPGTRQLTMSVANRAHKRKIHRPAMRLKKVTDYELTSVLVVKGALAHIFIHT